MAQVVKRQRFSNITLVAGGAFTLIGIVADTMYSHGILGKVWGAGNAITAQGMLAKVSFDGTNLSQGVSLFTADWTSGIALNVTEAGGYDFQIRPATAGGLITSPYVGIQVQGNAGASPANDITTVTFDLWVISALTSPTADLRTLPV